MGKDDDVATSKETNGDSATSKEANRDGEKEEGEGEKSNGGAKPDDLMAKFMAKKLESQTSSTDPLMAKFLTKGADSSKWSCDVCMISNPSDKVKCVACETPNPKAKASASGEEAKPTFNFGSGGGFKFRDAADASKTESAVSGFKFGSAVSQPAEGSIVTGGGFK